MDIRHLISDHSLLSRFVSEMRDVNIQKDALRFRRNIERVGEVMAYEISKELSYEMHSVQTPLGVAECAHISDKVVLGTILRAGLYVYDKLKQKHFQLHQNSLENLDGKKDLHAKLYLKQLYH